MIHAVTEMGWAFTTHLRPVALKWKQFCPPGDTGNIWRQFSLSQMGGGGADDVWWVEARDAAQPPTLHRRAPHTKYVPHTVQKFYGAKVNTP